MAKEYDYTVYINVAGVVSPTGTTITATPLLARERRLVQYPNRAVYQFSRFGDDIGRIHFMGGDPRSAGLDCSIWIESVGWVNTSPGNFCGYEYRLVHDEWALFNWPPDNFATIRHRFH